MSEHPKLLVELLAEEIPAWMLAERVGLLRSRLAERLAEYEGREIAPGRVHCDATSRRIWFSVDGLAPKQPDRSEELKGPPESAAFRDDAPTKALEGFLRKNAATIESIERRDGYVWLSRTVPGLSLGAFLARDLPSLVENVRWPRMMRWGSGDRSFIRPIHGVLALYGTELIDLEILGVRSARRTSGHRTRGRQSIEIESADTWEESLRNENVIVAVEDRLAALQSAARRLAEEVGGEPAEDPSIWSQWSYLTEYPGVVRSEFDESYLQLPEEVLVTVMRIHQKQLPIQREGHLSRYFLSIVDADSDPDGYASSGNAFVTNARFADALFFVKVDLERDLRERVEDLAHLQFQETLGDYRQKTERIRTIVGAIRATSAATGSPEELDEAALLAKADLVTEMVKEFTDLQGQIGGIYALRQGRSETVWTAIYDQYLPQSLEDALPRSEEGAILSLADRIDTLAGFFLVGMKPTGSRDPFALRRAAQGIVRILFNEEGWRVPIGVGDLVRIALDTYLQSGAAPDASAKLRDERAAIEMELAEFISERVRTVLEASWGYSYDEIAAAMAAHWSDSLPDLRRRVEALHLARRSAAFLSILDSAKRIANITPEGFTGAIREELLDQDAEKRLVELGRAVRGQIAELIEVRAYDRALQSFAAMADELESFFDHVLVNVEDQKVRENRLAILQLVGSAVAKIGDVTRIVVDRKALGKER